MLDKMAPEADNENNENTTLSDVKALLRNNFSSSEDVLMVI